jgi:hypothetical protein
VEYPLENHIKEIFIPAKRSIRRSFRIRTNQFIYRNKTYKSHISIDSFAHLADYHVYGRSGQEPLDKKKSQEAKILFVNSDRFDQINFEQFPNLNVIISGNTDTNFEEIPNLPSNIKLLLLQNCSVSAENIKTLPIGLENKRTGRYSNLKYFSTKISRSDFIPKVFVPPMSNTNPIRSVMITKSFEIPEIYDVKTNYLYEKEYFNLIKKYQFLLCLEGNGFENHRIWEALYLGIFPVMLRTKWSVTLDYLKLPILYTDDLSKITRYDLYAFWLANSNFNPDTTPQLWLKYWKDLINSHIDSP